jgi:hypothetical protein
MNKDLTASAIFFALALFGFSAAVGYVAVTDAC